MKKSKPLRMSNGSVLWWGTLSYESGDRLKPVRNVLHREDGPAIELPDGRVAWYWWGKEMPFKEWAYNAKPTNDEMAFYFLKYF